MQIPKFGVIASIMASSTEEFFAALSAEKVATSYEIRLDSIYHEIGSILPVLHGWLGPQPTILTLKSKEQGGMADISLEEQYSFWRHMRPDLHHLIASPQSSVFVDFDITLVEDITANGRSEPFMWEKIGCSLHDFDKTPKNIRAMLARLEATPAKAFLKLVTKAEEKYDGERMMILLGGYRGARPLIAFAMGTAGKKTRLECLRRGSAATYGYLPGFQKAAPGQLSIIELMSTREVQRALVGK